MHIPVSAGSIPRFISQFKYLLLDLKKVDVILASASAFNCFVWIHAFLDGNGRVARLMLHAMLLNALQTRG